MLTDTQIEQLRKLKGTDLLKAVKEEDLDFLPVDLSLKWCKARIQISNKINAKLGEENRQKEIARLEQETLAKLSEDNDE